MNKKRAKKNKREHWTLTKHVMRDKKAFTVFVVLRLLTIAVMVRCVFLGQWESLFTCTLALVLMMIPPFVEKSFKIDLPTTLEIIVFVFVFCAEILGEVSSYYVKFRLWDTALHTTSGFIFAAFGFCIVDLMNRNKNIRMELSPVTLAVVAFCFSMTIGVLWEFFEFGADKLLSLDMQKDYFVNSIYTVSLDPTKTNTVVAVKNITDTVIHTASGETVTISGYLDIGIIDTMKDLFVNFIGAVVFSIIGYFYIKRRGEGKIAPRFIPVLESVEKPQDGASVTEPETDVTLDNNINT